MNRGGCHARRPLVQGPFMGELTEPRLVAETSPIGGVARPFRRVPWLAAAAGAAVVVACSAYANLSFTVKDPADYRFFPPFQPRVNANLNTHLGGEYFNMARSLAAGEGFANPFDRPTGPTAWQPPVLPAILAGLLRVSGGNRNIVAAVVVVLQVLVLIGTGLLVLVLARQTTARVGPGAAAAVFVLGLLCHFWLCFQYTHDGWLVLLALDLLVAGLCWFRPLDRAKTAAAWGLFGGTCAMINPPLGLAWGVLSLVLGVRLRAWFRFGLAVLVAGLVLTPWTVRNSLVFGRLVPLKSNLFYEMYQSQCLQPDAQLQSSTFRFHPYSTGHPERKEYNRLGEAAYMDRKRQQLWEAIRTDPLDFLDRVAGRFLGATLWYVPFNRDESVKRPWVFRLSRLTHPLPFLALLVLLLTASWRPLHGAQWVVMGAYVLYLLPYVVASYYERYSLPLLGVKVLLVLWAADRLLDWRRR